MKDLQIIQCCYSALFFDADASEATAQVESATLFSGFALTNNDIAVV